MNTWKIFASPPLSRRGISHSELTMRGRFFTRIKNMIDVRIFCRRATPTRLRTIALFVFAYNLSPLHVFAQMETQDQPKPPPPPPPPPIFYSNRENWDTSCFKPAHRESVLRYMKESKCTSATDGCNTYLFHDGMYFTSLVACPSCNKIVCSSFE
jgi:hypothetical protein